MIAMLKDGGNTNRGKYDRVHVSRSKTFKSWLAGQITASEPRYETVDVTPEMAQHMLTFNAGNRPVRNSNIKLISRQMAGGDWRQTLVPIIFSRSGKLIDGQHRLHAIVESGATVKIVIAFGAGDDAFAFIDQGAKRSAGDIFAINGVPNYNKVAAATAHVLRYEMGAMHDSFSRVSLTPSDLYDAYLQRAELQDSVSSGQRFAKTRLAPISLMIALHYLCAKKNRSAADKFYETAATGFGADSRSDPALALHHKLVANSSSVQKLTVRAMGGLTVSAWNLSRMDRSGRSIRFDPEKKFPRII